MNLANRRLKEIRMEKLVWEDQKQHARNNRERSVFNEKIKILNKEEKDILKRMDVII